MKHLRLATILMLGAFSFSLTAMAQTNEIEGEWRFISDKTNVSISIASSREVSGFYVFNGKSCGIEGSYFPSTKRLKARCQNGEEFLEVTGFKMTDKDGFQLTVGNYTYALLRKDSDVEGTWQIEQRGGGRSYEGKLNLGPEDAYGRFTGTAVWNNHPQGRVEGKTGYHGGEQQIEFSIRYSDSLVGYYRATFSDRGNDMVGGTARANNDGPTVEWEAKRISRAARTKPGRDLKSSDDWLGTVWDEKEDGERGPGVWTRRGNTNVFDADWGGNKATLTIARSGNSVTVKRENSSDSNNCTYEGTLSDDGTRVSGSYNCDRYTSPEGWRWSATIR